MKRGRKLQPAKSVSGTEEYIGHITTPIEDDKLERVRTILKSHAVKLYKSRPPDNWWTLILPDGAAKRKKERQGKLTTYIVRLPDGFSFFWEAGILNRDGLFDVPPRVFIEQEPAGVHI